MVFDVRRFDELATKVTGIDNLQEIVQKFNDQGLVWKWRWCNMLKFRREIAERIEDFAGDCRNCGSIGDSRES